MILLVDLDLQKIHLHRFMYTIWKKFIIMIIIIRFGIDPGIYNTSIAATSNNLMIVWMVNIPEVLFWNKEEFGFVNSLPSFFFDKIESLKTYYIHSLFFKYWESHKPYYIKCFFFLKNHIIYCFENICMCTQSIEIELLDILNKCMALTSIGSYLQFR